MLRKSIDAHALFKTILVRSLNQFLDDKIKPLVRYREPDQYLGWATLDIHDKHVLDINICSKYLKVYKRYGAPFTVTRYFSTESAVYIEHFYLPKVAGEIAELMAVDAFQLTVGHLDPAPKEVDDLPLEFGDLPEPDDKEVLPPNVASAVTVIKRRLKRVQKNRRAK